MKYLAVIFGAMATLAPAASRAGYVDEILAERPLAYYRLEDNADATTVADNSGHGHDSLAPRRPAAPPVAGGTAMWSRFMALTRP